MSLKYIKEKHLYHNSPGRPAVPDELKCVPYSSRMSKPLLDWLRDQPEPMTKIIDRLVAEYKDRKENYVDDDLVDDIKKLIKRSIKR